MKKIKRFFAVLLALTMVLGMGVTTFAAEPDAILGNADDTGTIKISGITEETAAGFEVKAYQIVEPVYEGGAFKGSYKAVDALKEVNDFKNLTYTDATETIDGKPVQIQKLNISAAQMDAALAKKSDLGDGETMSVSGGVYQATVPVGTYLVVVSGSETKIYNNMVVSVYYGRDSVTGDTLTLGENTTAKMSSHPDTSKKVTSVTRPNNGGTLRNNSSANIGDTIAYSVEINPIPYYSGNNPKLELTDTLSKGLTLVATYDETDTAKLKTGVVVEIQNAATKQKVEGGDLVLGTDFTATLSNTASTAPGDAGAKDLVIDFVVNGQYTLKKFFEGKDATPALKAVITYSAVLNNDAKVNQEDNPNGIVLKYAKDSKVDGDPGTTPKKETHTYTFDIGGAVTTKDIFKKKGEGADANGLGGAEFTLYTDAACAAVYTNSGVTGTEGATFDGKVTSASDGNLYIKGLAAATYYMKETKAPAGYSINGHVYEIEIAPTYGADGKLTSWKVIVDGKEQSKKESAFTVTQEGTATGTPDTTDILNTKLITLPSTGGIGTTVFTIGGCAIMILAAALYFASRRKTAK